MKALLLIDGVLPPGDIICLGIELVYTLLVANRAEVVVKYLQATNSILRDFFSIKISSICIKITVAKGNIQNSSLLQ